ncbi:hypothetical protein [White spot syndrome virus]|uniref:Wsv087 n=1 Tax=White spot syndrome virus TaxID=342409 RepID=A0A2R2XFC7_9VIRU|nr:hypothetical protein [White spot syndrome virus]
MARSEPVARSGPHSVGELAFDGKFLEVGVRGDNLYISEPGQARSISLSRGTAKHTSSSSSSSSSSQPELIQRSYYYYHYYY